jgi:hypothetical protein
MTSFLAVAAKSSAVGFLARDFRLQFLDGGLPGRDRAPGGRDWPESREEEDWVPDWVPWVLA